MKPLTSIGCDPTINMTFGAVNFDYRTGRFHRKVDGRVGIIMTTHKLKILPKYFDVVKARIKQFEIRKNDRNYQIGDELHLCEWDGENFTGRELMREVVYMTDYEQKKGFLVLGVF